MYDELSTETFARAAVLCKELSKFPEDTKVDMFVVMVVKRPAADPALLASVTNVDEKSTSTPLDKRARDRILGTQRLRS